MEIRFQKGFTWGVIATVVMTIPMLIGMVTGIAPMPKPIPAAIMGKILGADTPKLVIMVSAIVSHLLYGGIWGGLFAKYFKPMTMLKGLGAGVFLWLIMQVIVLPFIGWGFFGIQQNATIPVATLVLHLVYGITLGGLLDRKKADKARLRETGSPKEA